MLSSSLIVERGEILEQIGALVSEGPGEWSLRRLVQRLAEILQTDRVLIAELDPPNGQRLRILACWTDGHLEAGAQVEFTTAFRLHVRDRNGWSYSTGVRAQASLAPIVGYLDAESCAGIPLVDGSGMLVGIIACANRLPFADAKQVTCVLRIVALRAAAELERRRAEEAVRVTEQRSRRLLEGCQDAITLLSATGERIYSSPTAETLLGYPLEAYQHLSTFDTVHPEDIAQARKLFTELVSRPGHRVSAEIRCRHQDGSWRWIYTTSVNLLEEPEVGAVVCTWRDVTAQHEAAEALEAGEERFRGLVANIPGAVYRCGVQPDGLVLYVSDGIEAITGYPASDYIGNARRSMMTVIHPDEQERVIQEVMEAATAGRPFELEYRTIHRSGEIRWIRSRGQMEFSPEGVPLWVDGILFDDTERQAAEEKARFQSAVLKALKEATIEGVLLVDPEAEILTCNRRFQELWQLSDDVIAPHSDEEALASAARLLPDSKAFVERVHHLMRTQEISEDEIPLRDGRILERYGAPVRGEDGTLYGRVWRFREITERKRAEQKDRAFQRLGQSLNTAATPEEAARVVLGVADELLGWDACWLDLFAEDLQTSTTLICQDRINGERVEVPVNPRKSPPGVMAREVIQEGRLRILYDPDTLPRPDVDGIVPFGDEGRTSASILCVPIRSGERLVGAMSIQSYTFYAYDEAALNTFQALADYCGGALERTLSEAARHELEQQLIQAQKMEAVGRLAGGVAHDFNNMLAVIGGYSELLLMNAPPGHSMNAPLEQIRKAGDRAAKLTQQLLAFSRKQILQPQVLNLNDVVLGVDRMLRRLIGADIELVTLSEPGVRKIEADPGQVEQVLLNLAVNARDAMPQGGKMTIQTRSVFVDEEIAACEPGARSGPYVLLTVTDTGCGMNAETLERIFEPFYTTKDLGKGTGLGLSTVYGIVSQSDGFIQVESAPQEGTTFRIYFPAVDQPATAEGAPDEAFPEGSHDRETVLVVEDEPMVRELIRRVLETCGYEVLEAMQGDEALRTAEAHSGPIHVLLTDVVMPRMGGRELVERFRLIRPDTKVLFMSGYTDDAMLRHGLAGMEAGFLQKPFSPQILAQTVDELLKA